MLNGSSSGDFENWMDRVDSILMAQFGIDTAGLPDCDYWNWHDNGMAPVDAAQLAIQEAGGIGSW